MFPPPHRHTHMLAPIPQPRQMLRSLFPETSAAPASMAVILAYHTRRQPCKCSFLYSHDTMPERPARNQPSFSRPLSGTGQQPPRPVCGFQWLFRRRRLSQLAHITDQLALFDSPLSPGARHWDTYCHPGQYTGVEHHQDRCIL